MWKDQKPLGPDPRPPQNICLMLDPYATALPYACGKQGPQCFAHYWGQSGLGWQILRTQEFVSCAKPLAYLLLCLCSCRPSFTGTQPLWSPFQNSWPLWAQHADTRFVKSMLPEHERRQQAGGRPTFSPQPCVSDWSLRSPSGQCALPTPNPLSLRSKSREEGGTKGKPSLTINIRQLFQNILDLVFIVEHTYQGKVLHTHNYKSFLGKKL